MVWIYWEWTVMPAGLEGWSCGGQLWMWSCRGGSRWTWTLWGRSSGRWVRQEWQWVRLARQKLARRRGGALSGWRWGRSALPGWVLGEKSALQVWERSALQGKRHQALQEEAKEQSRCLPCSSAIQQGGFSCCIVVPFSRAHKPGTNRPNAVKCRNGRKLKRVQNHNTRS